MKLSDRCIVRPLLAVVPLLALGSVAHAQWTATGAVYQVSASNDDVGTGTEHVTGTAVVDGSLKVKANVYAEAYTVTYYTPTYPGGPILERTELCSPYGRRAISAKWRQQYAWSGTGSPSYAYKVAVSGSASGDVTATTTPAVSNGWASASGSASVAAGTPAGGQSSGSCQGDGTTFSRTYSGHVTLWNINNYPALMYAEQTLAASTAVQISGPVTPLSHATANATSSASFDAVVAGP